MINNKYIRSDKQAGSIIVSILVLTLFLTTVIYSLIVLANSNVSRARGRVLLLQAQYAAESGADAAIAVLNSGNDSYTGSPSEVVLLDGTQYKTTYSVTVANGANSKEKVITATGKVYAPKTAVTANFYRSIEVVAQRSSTTTSSSMLSRNILEVESGVKNIEGRDIYINGYIHLNRNTTNLIAENIIVADKNTGASNCSIGGTGNLIKPTSFSDPAQTRTKITTAFNNCINPPGNSNNANFDVLANQTSISKVQSTLIPWSYFMDSSYQNAAGGCADWSAGSSPRSIPSTGNPKKTHYPDSASNIASGCGTAGDLNLGNSEYIIKDHVHIRANLCADTGCTPTFTNPDPAIKYIFVEGIINLNGLTTSAGSGPIVFVAYGGDPPSKTSVCPIGGSIYLGNTGTVSAPAAFLLAINGLCLDKTKFGASPALGGVSGKNLYVSTNPGTPFDLKLDPAFPVGQVPVDLSWRAARYRRL